MKFHAVDYGKGIILRKSVVAYFPQLQPPHQLMRVLKVCVTFQRYECRLCSSKLSLKIWVGTLMRSSFSVVEIRFSVVSQITRSRGSAKHCVEDDHAFQWNIWFSGTRQLETPQMIGVKFRRLIRSLRLPDEPKIGRIYWLGRPHRWVKYNLKNFFATFP
jgi:hypothetical protein